MSGDRAQDHVDRQRVLDVAARRFPERGWVGTSMTHVAAESGVSTARIQRLIGSKGEVFAAMVWRCIVGTHTDLQEVFDELHLEAEPDLDVRLDRVVATLLQIVPPMAHLVPVIGEAVARDATLRGIVQGAELQRVGTSRMLVRLLTRGEAPRPDAVPEVQLLCSGETYRSMAAFGWSHERYAAWLRHAFDHAVNGTAATVPTTVRLPR